MSDSLDTIMGIVFGVVGLYMIRAKRQGKLTRELGNRVAFFIGIVLVLVFAVALAFRFMRQ